MRGVGSNPDRSSVRTDGKDVGRSAQGGDCHPPAHQRSRVRDKFSTTEPVCRFWVKNFKYVVLRIRDVYPGSRIRSFFHPGSRIRIEEFKYFNSKNCFLSSRKYDPGCSSRIPNPEFLPVPHPGSSGQKGTGTRIPDPDPHHRNYLVYVSVPMLKNKNYRWYCTTLYSRIPFQSAPRVKIRSWVGKRLMASFVTWTSLMEA